MCEGSRVRDRLVTSLVAGLIVSSIVPVPAGAGGSFGGDCCADLEERVAELELDTARKSNRYVSLTISGQVNKGVLFWDDGNETDTYVVDNSVSSSRFSLSGEAHIMRGLSAGYVAEFEMDSAESNAVGAGGVGDDGGGTNSALDLRLAAWYLRSDFLGKLTVGQYSPATDNLILLNLGGTDVVATADTRQWNASFLVTGAGATTWGVMQQGLAALDTDRGDVVRYDSPSFFGFVISAAWGEDDLWDLALRWNGALSSFRLALGVGYIEDKDDNTSDWSAIMGSGSILHVPTGLFLTGAYYDRDVDAAAGSGSMFYLQAGLKRRFLEAGSTSVYVEYSNNEDFALETGAATTSSQVDVWGGGIVQNFDAAAMEIFASYRNYDGQIDAATTGDFSSFMTGARIRF